MKRKVSLAVLLLAWLAIAGCTGGSQAGCALGVSGPDPSRGAPGETFRVRGEGFTTDCYDTGQPGRPPPQQNIHIDFHQGERTWRLATVDADREGALNAKLAVPDNAGAGRATVIIRTADGYPVESPFRVPANR